MAISLAEAAKRLGFESTKAEQSESTAPIALTPEQLEEGKKGYEKFIEDQKNNMPWYGKVANAIEDVSSSISKWANTQLFGSGLNPWARKAEETKELPYAMSPEKPSADWSDEERNTFGYLYTQDPNEAAKYAIKIYNKYNAKEQEALDKVSETMAKDNPVLSSIASVALTPTSIVGTLNNISDYAISKKYGETVKSADYVSALNNQSTRGAIANQLNTHGTVPDNLWMIGGKGWGDVYSLGMSIADSFYLGAGTMTGAGMLLNRATYFSRSATEGYNDAISRGLSPDAAGLYGVIIGAIECITESVSDKLLANVGKDQAKGLLGEVLRQMGQEGVEEFVSALVDALAQEGLFGENSDRQRLIKYYMSEFNMSHEEASTRALVDLAGEIVFAGLSGAVSGGFSAGAAGGLKTAWDKASVNPLNQTATKELSPLQDKMLEEGKSIENGDARKVIDKLASKKESGKELSGYDLRRLQSSVAEGKASDTKSKVTLAVAERLKEKGVKTEDISGLTKIIMSKALGEKLTKAQEMRLKNNQIATAISNEMDIDNMLSGNFDSKWAADAGINEIRDISDAVKKALSEQNETDVAEGQPITRVNLSKEAKEQIRYTFTGADSAYTPQSENSRIHTDEIKSATLNAKQVEQIRAIERVANALGVDVYMYESEYTKENGRRYVTKDGEVISDSGYYDPSDKSVHIDIHAGETGKGTMLFTASHELVHWIKDSSIQQFNALKDFVLDVLGKEGVNIDTLIEKQIAKARENNRTMDRDGAIEEIVADACMSVLSTESGIQAVTSLKTKNRGLWNTLKRFFTNFFNRIDKMYKGVKVDSAEGQYLADMHEEAKRLRDLFAESAAVASEANKTAPKQTKAQQEEALKKGYIKTKNIKSNARLTESHRAKLAAMSDSASAVPMDKLLERYDAIAKVWNDIGGELNSNFLEAWNSKEGKDRVFTIFKAQSGYKYNVELSSMCKKGIPLFEAIDTIVREEILNQLDTKTLGKAEKEILYDLLKARGFDIPCAICYVEQARQREGAIIDAFLDGKIEKSKTGKVTQFKIGWNETYDALEKGMKSLGVDYTFPTVDRSIATDNYNAADAAEMDAKTQDAFYKTLLALINKEIARYNSTKDAKTKARMPLNSITPSEIKRCLSGTLGSNLKLYKTIAMNPASRFRIKSDLLYSSMTTTNLATAHPQLYSLFNSQGGVSTFKTKQATAIYWADILNKKWESAKLRTEGGVRNQSNSDFMMYTLLDHAQMYIDFTAKGYYLQAYTKVLAELKLFGLSQGKINASFIPKVVVYYNEDGTVNYEKTRENAGLDEKGNPIYDDIEGVNHAEAFMLLEDAEYSKSIGGICIGYSDNHISKLLDDKRIQQIIGFHDKTDDPTKRYRGARYAKNYNGENEAQKQHSDGTLETIHIGFNQFVIAAEKLFKKDKATETFSGTAEYNGKQYKADDIPKLAADMYLEMCREKNYIPAYDQFKGHPNYYKLLADFSLYDSEGHYAPHKKVAYNMPDVVPYLDENGKKQYMPSRDYIKQELKKELTVRDDIAAALSDHSEEGLIPQFVKRVNELHSEMKRSARQRRISDTQAKITARYKRTVDQVMAGTYNSKNSVLMGYTPEIFRKLGMPSLPFVFGAGHIYSTAVTEAEAKTDSLGRYNPQTNYHGLGVDTVKKLYSAIQDPIIIIAAKDEQNKNTAPRSLHSVVAIIDVGDSSKHLLMPVEITAERLVNGNRINVNTLSSSYMRNVGGLVEEAIAQTNTGEIGVYYMKKEATNLLSGRVQFPKQLTGSAASADGIIHQFSEKINMQIDDVTKSSQFTNWFGDWQNNPSKASKVVNDDGTPMIVYHGSKSGNIKTFRTTNENGTGGLYLTTNRSVAESYAGNSGEVYENYVNIRRPLIVDADGAYYDDISTPSEMIGNKYALGGKTVDTNAIAAFAREAGYDGVIIRNVREAGGFGDDIIAFHSNQIKSIDNVGTFDKRKDNVMYSSRRKRTATSTPLPFVSGTAGMIVTDIEQQYTPTLKDKVETGFIGSQIAFVNSQAGIESAAKKYDIKNMESLVQAARNASNQAMEMISGDQYRIGADTKEYLGEGLQKIMQPVEAKGDEYKRTFFDYLFHQHNADRMSLERRSIEWNEEAKAELENNRNRLTELEKEMTALEAERKQYARKRTPDAVSARKRIDLRIAEIKGEMSATGKIVNRLQRQVDNFEPLKNKAVLRNDQAKARKAEISERQAAIQEEIKELGRKQANREKVKALRDEFDALDNEAKNLSVDVSEEESRKIIAEYEANYPEFLEIAEKIWAYNRNVNQYRVDTGLISQDNYDYLQKLYPHYIPTYREGEHSGIAAVKGRNNIAVNKSIKTATGSTRDLLNPIVIMARQTMETIRAGRINRIASALYNGAVASGDKTYLTVVSSRRMKSSEVVDIDPTELRPKNSQVTFFQDGKRVVLQVSSEIFAGFDAFNPAIDITNPIINFAANANKIFKRLVTSANPVFLVRNALRDIQDAGINTKYGKTFVQNYARAVKEIMNNGQIWKMYKAMGGLSQDIFDFDKGFKAEQTKRGFTKALTLGENATRKEKAITTAKNLLAKMESLNSAIECLPRLAEFMSSLEAGNTAEQAMLDAADVTTNFARTGKITKSLNNTVIPFLNPAIQGADKAIRNITTVKSVRAFAVLAAKATIIGILPFIFNAMLYRDDEEYKDLKETDKENNYLFKVGDVFIKLPRGRMASVLAGAYNRTAKMFEGEDADWLGYIKNASTQMNPLENMARTIFSPFLDVANNVTWYGSAIEGKQFENLSPSQRYDESTSSIAIALGKVLNYSPKKIHYLLDQYSGVIGDFVLPATTQKAESGFLAGNFILDPVTSNRLSDDFYDMYYEAQYAKNADENNDIAEYQVKHLNRIKSAISELYDEKSRIQSSDLSDSEKLAQTRTIQILINEAYKTALNDYELVTNAISATSKVNDKYRYAEIVRLVYGADEALKVYDEGVYAKSKTAKSAGITSNVYYKYYFSIKDIKSDTDKNGSTIPGSKKEKVIAKIDKLNLTEEKRLFLIASSGYALSDSEDAKLIKYLNSLKLSATAKLNLAEMCGYTVKNGKIVHKG